MTINSNDQSLTVRMSIAAAIAAIAAAGTVWAVSFTTTASAKSPPFSNGSVTGHEIIGNGQGGAAEEIISNGLPGQPSVGADISVTGQPGQNVTGLQVIQTGPGIGLRVIQNGPGVGLRSTVTVGTPNTN
jgi:hypothetical protein